MSRSRVLVTGGSGFIGRHALPRLVSDGFDVHAVSSRAVADWPPGVTGHRLDLHDAKAVSALVADLGASHLLHLAWDVAPGAYLTSLNNLDWVRATLTLLRAFVQAGGRRVVCAGTSAEYDWSAARCVEASTPVRPATLYAACKSGVCGIVECMANQMGFEWAWGRVFFLYGPDEPAPRLLPSIIETARSGRPVMLRHPAQVRDYMHVSDVGGAFAAITGSHVSGPVNIGSGVGVALEELVRLVGQALDLPALNPRRDGSAEDPFPIVVADVARLRDEVGFRPQFPLDEGVRQTVAWWTTHRPKVEA